MQATKSSPIKKERRVKAKKDPNAPKKAGSAYMIWLQANRPSLTKPGMGVTDVAKAAGVAWGKMTDKTVCQLYPFIFYTYYKCLLSL